MKNEITEVVFILDRSGSMSGFESDTIGGFNSTIEKQKKQMGIVYISTVLFSNTSMVLYDRVPIDKIRPMSENDYQVGGCTALLDAIGDAIYHIANIHKYARPDDVPKHTIFIISTDGMENASRKYSSDDIKRKIAKQTEKYGWEFIFMAANIDAVETAGHIGIREERAVNYTPCAKGMEAEYSAMSDAITTLRNAQTLDNGMWRRDIDKDN